MAGSEMDDVIEGKLQRKQDGGHWRHFIQDGHNNHYIPCGSIVGIQVTREGWEIPGKWTYGYFNERLVEPIEAYLSIGNIYPDGKLVEIILPLGTMVSVRK